VVIMLVVVYLIPEAEAKAEAKAVAGAGITAAEVLRRSSMESRTKEALIVTLPPLGVNFNALLTRFLIT
jgi:hypothetical protein